TLIHQPSKYKYPHKKPRQQRLQHPIQKPKLPQTQQLIPPMHKNPMDIEDITNFADMHISQIPYILDN
ncbi:hypothetical protein, partial [Bacillus thuringiensis]|uniref:hypothetical protein n=1 Tax=Bacillus thuringiensis TaxID=1428 RepID=UPI003D6D9500